MAKKVFKDLRGPEYTTEYQKGHFGLSFEKRHFKTAGDTFYMIDKYNNFEIVNVICKSISNYHSARCDMYYCLESDAEKFKEFYPSNYYGRDKHTPQGMMFIRCKNNRTHNGLLFTDINEAQEHQAKLREGKTFFQLKKGDTVYVVGGKTNEIEKYIIENTILDNNMPRLTLTFSGGKDEYVYLSYLAYEDKACALYDTGMYFHLDKHKIYDSGNLYFFINESDAKKLLEERTKRQKKSATDEYIKRMENYDGKPIKHTDSNQNALHYGDKVAYAVSGGSGSPFVSIGKIVGETEQKVTIEDTAKKNVKKHNVYPCSIILIEAAQVNMNSGFILNSKTK